MSEDFIWGSGSATFGSDEHLASEMDPVKTELEHRDIQIGKLRSDLDAMVRKHAQLSIELSHRGIQIEKIRAEVAEAAKEMEGRYFGPGCHADMAEVREKLRRIAGEGDSELPAIKKGPGLMGP